MIVVVVCQLAFIAIQEYLHMKERKSLLNRIMANDAAEFKMLEQQLKPKKKEDTKASIEFV